MNDTQVVRPVELTDAQLIRQIAKRYADSLQAAFRDHHDRLIKIAERLEALQIGDSK